MYIAETQVESIMWILLASVDKNKEINTWIYIYFIKPPTYVKTKADFFQASKPSYELTATSLIQQE